MRWFALALGSALLWSAGAVLVKKGFSFVNPLWNNLVNALLSLLVYIPAAVLLTGFHLPAPGWVPLAAVLAAALLYQLFYYCLSQGQLSLTGTIIAGYPLFTILWAHLFLGERLAGGQYAGAALVLAGGIVVALPGRAGGAASRGGPQGTGWILWGLAGALALGTGDFLAKLSVSRIGPYANLFFLALANNLAAGVNWLVDRRNRPAPALWSRSFLPTLLGILVHLFGALLFLIAFGFGPASLVSTVSSIYPALVALLAVRFLKESLEPGRWAGIAITVAGLLLIGLASGLAA